MPHVVIEHSSNINNTDELLNVVNQTLIDSGLFLTQQEIKARAYINEKFLIGLAQTEGYIFVTVALLQGRTKQQKQMLGHHLKDALNHYAYSIPVQICIEIKEIDPQFYFKTTTAIH